MFNFPPTPRRSGMAAALSAPVLGPHHNLLYLQHITPLRSAPSYSRNTILFTHTRKVRSYLCRFFSKLTAGGPHHVQTLHAAVMQYGKKRHQFVYATTGAKTDSGAIRGSQQALPFVQNSCTECNDNFLKSVRCRTIPIFGHTIHNKSKLN